MDRKELQKSILENSLKAGACHLGSALSCVDILIEFFDILKDEDVFIFSKASGVSALYCVLADKGYDSKDLRKFVLFKLRAKPVIPYRRNSGITKLRGRFKHIKLDKELYRRRFIIENIFFCVKRKYGSVLRNRTYVLYIIQIYLDIND